MHARCSICSDLFDLRQDVSANTCGHVFHADCLNKWLERSKSCPQCRLKIKDKNLIFKLFFDVDENDEKDNENDEWKNELENLRVDVIKLKKEKREYKKKNEELSEEIEFAKAEKESLQSALQEHRSTNKILKQELKHLEKLKYDHTVSKNELESLRKKMLTLSSLQRILDNATLDVSELVTKRGGIPDVDEVLLWNSLVRKELIKSEDKQKRLKIEVHAVKKEKKIIELKLKQKIEKIDEVEKDLKDAQEEVESLKKRVEILANEMTQNTEVEPEKKMAVKRLISESPMPEQFRPKLTSSSQKESWIPLSPEYTPSPVTHPPQLKIRRFGVPLKSNLRITTSQKLTSQKTTSKTNEQYNGLGGRSKHDLFPVPKNKEKSETFLDKYIKKN